jgi:hypothetical protein
MAKRGTRVNIDLDELAKLCALQCTDEELAAWFKVTTRTIERRRLEPEFGAIMERGKAMGRISVRRLQMKLLEQGNATMGVWLGKQLLGQTDHATNSISVNINQGFAVDATCTRLKPDENLSQVAPLALPIVDAVILE